MPFKVVPFMYLLMVACRSFMVLAVEFCSYQKLPHSLESLHLVTWHHCSNSTLKLMFAGRIIRLQDSLIGHFREPFPLIRDSHPPQRAVMSHLAAGIA